MAKEEKAKSAQPAMKYSRVQIAGLKKGRRGKHHDLVRGILGELKSAPATSALEIPLEDVGGIGLAKLRSAVHRAASAEGVSIETLADEKNFYVWKRPASK